MSSIWLHKLPTVARYLLAALILSLAGFAAYWRIKPHEAAPAKEQTSLAVLPFVDASRSHDQEYFSDGISEEILDGIAQLPAVRVPARTSSFAFKSKELPVAEIARQLNVASVLEGSVRRAGKRIRITAQLTDVATGKPIWSQTYDRDASDMSLVQAEIARAVAGALKLPVAVALESGQTANARAHELYLRGLYYWNRRRPEELTVALEQFTQAAREDPAYARAWAAIAQAYGVLPAYRDIDPREASRLGKDAALRALELDAKAADAHAALGYIAGHLDWSWKEAQAQLDTAVLLNPNSADARAWRAELYTLLGHTESALHEADRAVQLNPLSDDAIVERAVVLRRAGRTAESVEALRALKEKRADFRDAHLDLLLGLIELHRYDEALDLAKGDTVATMIVRGVADPAQKEAALQVVGAWAQRAPLLNTIDVANAYRSIGYADSALAVLNRAADEWAPSIAYFAYEPASQVLRKYPAYQEFVRKLNLR